MISIVVSSTSSSWESRIMYVETIAQLGEGLFGTSIVNYSVRQVQVPALHETVLRDKTISVSHS